MVKLSVDNYVCCLSEISGDSVLHTDIYILVIYATFENAQATRNATECQNIMSLNVFFDVLCVTVCNGLKCFTCYMLQCVTCYSVLPTGHSRPVTDDLLASFRDTVQVKPVTAGVRCEGRHHSGGRGCLIIGIIVLASCVMCHMSYSFSLSQLYFSFPLSLYIFAGCNMSCNV